MFREKFILQGVIMRRRRKKDADKKLLSYKDYIINGMVEQVFIESKLEDQYLNPFDNRIFIKDEVYKLSLIHI